MSYLIGRGRYCVGGFCVAPTCSDVVLDGDESAIDCGGSCPNTENSNGYYCGSGKTCRSPGDCVIGHLFGGGVQLKESIDGE